MTDIGDTMRALEDLVKLCGLPGIDPEAVESAQATVEAVGLRPIADPWEFDLVGAAVHVSRAVADYAVNPSPGALAVLDGARANLAHEVSRASDRAWCTFWTDHQIE